MKSKKKDAGKERYLSKYSGKTYPGKPRFRNFIFVPAKKYPGKKCCKMPYKKYCNPIPVSPNEKNKHKSVPIILQTTNVAREKSE